MRARARIVTCLALLFALTLPTWAEAPTTSIRPMPRSGAAVVPVPDLSAASTAAVLNALADLPVPPVVATPPRVQTGVRPATRPGGLFGQRQPTGAPLPQGEADRAPVVTPRAAPPQSPAVTETATTSPPPRERPKGLGALFRRAALPDTRYPMRGSVCGNPAIRGETVARIRGSGSCGIADPVRITEVSGVRLSTPATVDCSTALALREWLDDSAKPIVGRRGGGIAGLEVAASYSCRTRNNRPGARISEHAKGRAIDISEIRLVNGSSLSVLKDWRGGSAGPILRKLHQAACGPFGTVLGPNSDSYHRNHFHLDTASYRSGPYCR